MDKVSARAGLARLLDEYVQARARGDLHDQPEAAARTWVERFLTVFGWDPGDPRQVRQEYRISGRAARRLRAEGTSHRRPDYCLLVNGRRSVYVDAKKFGADIEGDASIAYQVRCYGWSEGFRISCAFDLDELAVFDCRVRPSDRDEAPVARVWHVRIADYLANFDRLWDYFSREALESGSLARLHPDDEAPRGSLTLDADFESRLGEWRRKLAATIMRYGGIRDAALVSAASQRILDRIIFLRMCEEFGLEEHGSLREMAASEDGFWARFLDEQDRRWCRIYDGMLFPSAGETDPTGIDDHLRRWNLRGRVFQEIIDGLYYPQPYKFDVVPIELLGGIYERYLGKRLRLIGNEVEDEYKPEYQRTQGAVYTPSWVVERILERTLRPLLDGKDPEGILRLRIVDPACGSGGFLLGAYDLLERSILMWLREHAGDERGTGLVLMGPEGLRLTPSAVHAIMTGCLFGVDIDPAAVEVARMSLALRYLERVVADEPDEPRALLSGIGRNVRQGNSLVGSDVLGLGLSSPEDVAALMPFDWRSRTTGFGDVTEAGGFDAVVGNPPYIEVKRYREWMPDMYRYLKESGNYKTAEQGKTDIAVPFMEKGIGLLSATGRLGFIIQNRFFRTEYGHGVRGWLARDRMIESIEDFRDLQVFRGRTTYTSILTLRRGSPSMRYRCFETLEDAEGDRRFVDADIPWAGVTDEPWSFDQPDLLTLHDGLSKRVGTISSHGIFSISVGLQTLWGKLYQLDPVEVRARTVVGRNGLGEEVTLEKSALRPLCRNRGFYPFRVDNADAWVIFPYDVVDGAAHEIPWRQFAERFPKTSGYLREHRRQLSAAVEMNLGTSRWHLYTRPQNLVLQTRHKVLFPMTIEDTLASVDSKGDVYQDNVNVNSITFAGAALDQLNSIAAVFNSSVFNALARLKAGLNETGWRKFNRQFAEVVPFPRAAVDDPRITEKLSTLAVRITDLQEHTKRAAGEGAREALHAALNVAWEELDREVEIAYGLSADERVVVQRYPRRVDRFALLLRQATEAPAGDE
jgi:hypothetical protein